MVLYYNQLVFIFNFWRKQKMKKLTALIAMALVITITGVYAAWNYAEGNVSNTTKWLDGNTTIITDATQATAKGTIHVDTTHLQIIIDDTDSNYEAELSVEGYILVSFTPNPGASVTEIPLQFCLQANPAGTPKYNDSDIFTFNSNQVAINSGNAVGSAQVQIDATELISECALALNGTITLPTIDDYTNFKNALHVGSIGIVVSEAGA